MKIRRRDMATADQERCAGSVNADPVLFPSSQLRRPVIVRSQDVAQPFVWKRRGQDVDDLRGAGGLATVAKPTKSPAGDAIEAADRAGKGH